MKDKIIYGFHSLMAALSHQPENILSLYCHEKKEKEDNARMKDLILKANELHIPIQPISQAKLDKLTESSHHQGVAARLREGTTLHEKDLFAWLENPPKIPLLLILEGVQDPHNLGACLRSAEALGVDWVIMPKVHSAPLNATVSKIACGADQTLSIVSVSNLSRLITQIKELGVWVVGTCSEAPHSLMQSPLKRSVALVMGTEGKGLKRLTMELCDEMVKIPLMGTVQSLNLSVATGICLYECLRQRAHSL